MERLEKLLSRREFLKLGWGALLAAGAAAVGGGLRFLVPNVSPEPPDRFRAGFPSEYALGVSTRWVNSQRVWLVRSERGFHALRARCTHLGCTPRWIGMERRFRCPCHGSTFTPAGDVTSGPAPRALDRCAIDLAATGELLIDKGRLEGNPGPREAPPYFLPWTS